MSWLDGFFQTGGAVTLAGEVTGPSGSTTVAKFSNATVPGTPLSGAGLFVVSGSSTSWTARALTAADVGALTGDVTGLISATVVAGIGTGLTTVPVHAPNLTFDATLTPIIGMAQNGSGAGVALTIQGQAAKTGSAAVGGNLILGGGAGDGTAAPGSVIAQLLVPGGTTEARFLVKRGSVIQAALCAWDISPSFAGLWIGPGTIPGDAGGYALLSDGTTNYFNCKSGGTLQLQVGGSSTLWIDTAGIVFHQSPTIRITQNQSTTGAGQAFTLSAQAAKTGSAAAGGNLVQQTGAGDGAGAPGTWVYKAGATQIGVMSLSSGNYWQFVPDATNTNGLNFACGSGQNVIFNASAGTIYQIAPTILTQDGAGATAITWTVNATGSTTIAFASGVTTATISAAVGLTLGSTTGINTLLGGVKHTTITVTNTNRTLDTTTKDTVVFVKTSSAGVNLTLPAPSNGRRFRVIDINGTLSTNNLTLVRNGSEKINGLAASKVLTTDWGQWEVWSDGTDWYVG